MSMKRLVMLAICAGSLLFAAACGGGGSTNDTGGGNQVNGNHDAGNENPPAVVVDRPETYDNSCIQCHGTDLEGRTGPNSNLQQVGAKLSREEIITQIKKGGGRMPGFENSLSEEEINELADWLVTLK